MSRQSVGWYVTFAALAVAVFGAVYALTGDNAVAAAARFLWNALVFLVNGAIRLAVSPSFWPRGSGCGVFRGSPPC